MLSLTSFTDGHFYFVSQPPLLASHFMMNLRQSGTVVGPPSVTNPQNLSEFLVSGFVLPSSFIGNIGEPLDYRQEHNAAEERLNSIIGAQDVGDQTDVAVGYSGEAQVSG